MTTEPLWRTLLKSALDTKEYEITCEECFNVLDQYADLLIEGADPRQVMPLVRQHLSQCPDCTDLIETLITIIREASEDKESPYHDLVGK